MLLYMETICRAKGHRPQMSCSPASDASLFSLPVPSILISSADPGSRMTIPFNWAVMEGSDLSQARSRGTLLGGTNADACLQADSVGGMIMMQGAS